MYAQAEKGGLDEAVVLLCYMFLGLGEEHAQSSRTLDKSYGF